MGDDVVVNFDSIILCIGLYMCRNWKGILNGNLKLFIVEES